MHVCVRLGTFPLDGMKDGGEYAPGLGQLIRAHKVDLTSAEYVQDQAMVGLRHLHTLRHHRGNASVSN